MRSVLLRAAVLPLLAFAAGCGGDGGTGPDRLTAEEVAGVYQVCELRFVPDGDFLPQVDIREQGFSSDPNVRRPVLGVNPDQTFQPEYTRAGKFTTTLQPGLFTLGAESVTFTFDRPAEVRSTLLIADRVTLDFTDDPQALTVSAAQGSHEVARADYTRLAEISEANVPDPVQGRLAGSFAAGDCP